MRHSMISLLLATFAVGCGNTSSPETAVSRTGVAYSAPGTVDPVPVSVQQITFDDLNVLKLLNVDELTWDIRDALPKSLSELDGKRVRIRGWIEPPRDMGFDQRAFFLFSKKPELEFARIKSPDIEPVAVGDHASKVFGLESTDNFEILDPPVTDALDFSIEIPGGINRNPKWWGQADETIHVRLRKGTSLTNTRKRSVEVIGSLKVGGITDCPPARWMYVLKDADVVEIPDAE